MSLGLERRDHVTKKTTSATAAAARRINERVEMNSTESDPSCVAHQRLEPYAEPCKDHAIWVRLRQWWRPYREVVSGELAETWKRVATARLTSPGEQTSFA